MEKKNGPWTIKESNRKYKNDFIEVIEDKVIQPDGKNGEYATANVKAGVCVLPIDDDGNVYLTKQFRYAFGADSLETPCGAIEDEDALSAAKREIKEELGIEADEWIDFGTVEIDTSIVRCPAHFFVARKLTFGETHREGVEVMKSVKMPFDEAVEKVLSGEIKQAISVILILKAKLKLYSNK